MEANDLKEFQNNQIYHVIMYYYSIQLYNAVVEQKPKKKTYVDI